MAVFPQNVVFKNSTAGLAYVVGAIKPGSQDGLVTGELLLYTESDGFRLYSLSLSGVVTQVSTALINENKGSLTVTNGGDGTSSFTLNPASVTTTQLADSSVTSAKISGTVAISKGGTGQATASAAINALLPSQAGNSGKILTTTGSSLFWASKIDSINDFDEVDISTVPQVPDDRLTWNSSTSKWEATSDISPLTVPATSTSTGRLGQLTYDSDYLYSCVATNQWKRAALSSWNYSRVLAGYLDATSAIYAPQNAGPVIPELVGRGAYTGGLIPSIPWPSGHRIGDIGLLIITTNFYPNINTVATAGGWTLITNIVNGNNNGLALYYKYALSSNEPSLAWSTNQFNGAQIIVFRNITATSPVDAINTNFVQNTSSGQVQPLSVTTTAPNDLVLFFQMMGGTCSTAGGCQVASSTTLYSPLYYDDEIGNNTGSGDPAGLVQIHAGRKIEPGVASSTLTYASANYTFSTNTYRITAALKKRGRINPQIEIASPRNVASTAGVPRVGYVDPHWDSVSLLMSMDGANGSTTFTDKSANNYVFSTFNGAQISTTQSRFGGSSGFFDGVDDYLVYPGGPPNTAPTNLAIWSTVPFTVECWFRFSADNNNTVISSLINVTSGVTTDWSFGPTAFRALKFAFRASQIGGGTTTIALGTANNVLAYNTWYHIAMTQNSGTIRVFLNGTQVASSSGYLTPLYAASAPLYIGSAGSGTSCNMFSGYID